MVKITYSYIDTNFAFYEYTDFFFISFIATSLYCFVGCLSIIVWTNAVFGVLQACVLHFCICTCSAQLSLLHMERRSRNTIIIIIIVY